MTKIFYDKDADISLLEGKTVGIIGYGNQGRAQALNMKDSGITSILIATARDETYEKAEKDGFQLTEIQNITRQSDILFLLIPDEIMPQVYEEHVAPNLRPGMVLNFASGYNITFRQIVPPDHVDVIMVAPRMIGDGVRNLFLEKKGYPAFIAVEQNASGSAREIALALAKAMGATRKGTIEVTMKDETMLDLLAEQAIWPMIMSVITEAFRFEVEKGHPAAASLVELYISKEPAYMFEKMAEMGLFKQMPLHSHTSQYGQMSRAEALDKSFIRKTLEDAYEYLEKGNFAREWKEEQEKGMPEFRRLVKQAMESDISRLEEDLINNS
ncbi:MAG: ketol-acid reductoisomerase [Bacteroidales bacterium]|nr:ketol-acid reductoisomerase [Bacteroidales bacterium]